MEPRDSTLINDGLHLGESLIALITRPSPVTAFFALLRRITTVC